MRAHDKKPEQPAPTPQGAEAPTHEEKLDPAARLVLQRMLKAGLPPPPPPPPPPMGREPAPRQPSPTPSAPTPEAQELYSPKRDEELTEGIRARLPAEIPSDRMGVGGVPVDLGPVRAGFTALFEFLRERHGISREADVGWDRVLELNEQTFVTHFAVQQELDEALKTEDHRRVLSGQGITDPAEVRKEILSNQFLRGLAEGDAGALERLDTLFDQIARAKAGRWGNVDEERAEMIKNCLTIPARSINGHVLLNTKELGGLVSARPLDEPATARAREANALRHLLVHEFMHVHSAGSDRTFADAGGQGVYREAIKPDEAFTELLARRITDALTTHLGDVHQYNEFPEGGQRYEVNINALDEEFNKQSESGKPFDAPGKFDEMLKYYFGAMKPRTAGPAATTSVEAGPAQAEGSSSAEQLALQLAPGTGSAAVAATGAERSAVQDVVSSPGRRLDETTRGEMETALGADFSDVRVHSDPVARRSASDLGARAYTAGEHVVVGDGGTDRHTLAHELSHVIQQRQGPVAGTDRGDGLVVSDPNDTFERAAEADATRTTVDPGPGPRFGHHRTTGGRHSVQRMVEPDTGPSSEPASTGGEEPTKPAVIIQPGYASGDQFAVAALLIAEPDRHVYITYKEVDKKSTQEAAEKRKQFYDESGVGKRARVVKDTELDKSLEEYHGKVYKAASSRQQQKRPGKFQIDLETVTESVGKKFEEKEYADFLRREIRKKWIPSAVAGDGGDQDDWVREWLDVRGVSDVDKKEIAILWSRFSGKMGEAHVEHDTGFLAMRQIIEQIGELDYVLIVGDRGGKDKFEKLAEYYQDIKSFGGLNAHVVDMTEFWNDEDFKRRSSADGEKKSTRTDQFRVFDYLNRKAHARHLGFRSGNLEAMALMGFTVRYLEEPNSSGGPRMEAFHGTQIGYERLLIQQPPTAAGQNELVRRMELGKDAKEQSYEEWKSKKVEVLFKGFTEADLSTIKAYLVHGNPAIDLNRDMIREVCALESHPSLPVLDEQARRFRARAKGLRDSARKLAGTVGGSDSNVKKKEHEAEGNDERAMEKEREALKLVMVGIDELVEHWLESEGEVALLRALYLFAPHVIGRLVGASTISP